MSTPSARIMIAEATGRPQADIPDEAAIGILSGWDSLAHMRLAEALEHALGRPLTSDEIIGLRSLSDVAALLASRANAN